MRLKKYVTFSLFVSNPFSLSMHVFTVFVFLFWNYNYITFLLPLPPLLHLSLLSICLISESWQYSSWVYNATEGQCFFPCAIYNQEHTFKHDLGKCVKLFNSWQKRSESHFWRHVENDIFTAEICPELNSFPLSAWRDICTELDMQLHEAALSQSKSP